MTTDKPTMNERCCGRAIVKNGHSEAAHCLCVPGARPEYVE